MSADEIFYSNKYNDDKFEYRWVLSTIKYPPKTRSYAKTKPLCIFADMSSFQRNWLDWHRKLDWWQKTNGDQSAYNNLEAGSTTWFTRQSPIFYFSGDRYRQTQSRLQYRRKDVGVRVGVETPVISSTIVQGMPFQLYVNRSSSISTILESPTISTACDREMYSSEDHYMFIHT